jgi:tetratricopeptide (TPR) repeat protein
MLFFSAEALDEAIVLLERAAAIYERAGDGDHSIHLQVLQSLVRRYNLNEAFEDAERHARRALDIARERFGAEHVEVATCLALLASVAQGRFDHEEALECAEQAVEVRSKYVKENPSDLYDDLMRLGDIQLSLDDFDGARVSFRAAMELVEKALDADPERKGRVLVQCAKAALYEETPELAVKLLQDAAEFLSRAFGETDFHLLEVLEDLGMTLVDVGDFDGAEAALQRMLALTDIHFDPNDSRRAEPREQLAELAMQRRDFARAVQYSEEALAIVVSEFGSDSTLICLSLDTAAEAHVADHNLERAKELSEWVIRVLRLPRDDDSDESEFLKRCERRLATIEKQQRR